MSLNDLFNRIADAFLWAIGALILAFITSFLGFLYLSRHSTDGQTGIGCMMAAFYVGCIAAIATFVVHFRKHSSSRQS